MALIIPPITYSPTSNVAGMSAPEYSQYPGMPPSLPSSPVGTPTGVGAPPGLMPSDEPVTGWRKALQSPLFWGGVGLLLQGPSRDPINPLQSAAQGLAMGATWMQQERLQGERKRREELENLRIQMERERLGYSREAAERERTKEERREAALERIREGIGTEADYLALGRVEPGQLVQVLKDGKPVWVPRNEAAGMPAVPAADPWAGMGAAMAMADYQMQNRLREAAAKEDQATGRARKKFTETLGALKAIANTHSAYSVDPRARDKAGKLRRELAEFIARARQPTGILREDDLERAEQQIPDIWGPIDRGLLNAGGWEQLEALYGEAVAEGQRAAALSGVPEKEPSIDDLMKVYGPKGGK